MARGRGRGLAGRQVEAKGPTGRLVRAPRGRSWPDPQGPRISGRGRAHQRDGLIRVAAASGLLADGEQVLVIDPKGRRYLLRLREGASFHTHAGILAHDSVIGREEGSTVEGSTGRSFVVVRPTLADVVVKMPRGAQVIYPKDLGAILLAADVGPGMVVLEAGAGC